MFFRYCQITGPRADWVNGGSSTLKSKLGRVLASLRIDTTNHLYRKNNSEVERKIVRKEGVVRK